MLGMHETDKFGPGLRYAIIHGDLEKVRLLIAVGIDVNEVDEDGDIPLHFAAGTGNLEIMLALLAAGSEVNGVDAQGNTALHIVIGSDNQNEQIIQALVFSPGFNLNMVNEYGQTALMLALDSRRWSIARFLIEQGAALDIVFSYGLFAGVTALSLCAVNKQWELIRLLLKKGASLQLTGIPFINPTNLEQLARFEDNTSTLASKMLKAANTLFKIASAPLPRNEIEMKEIEERLGPVLARLRTGLNAQVYGKTALEIAIENNNIIVRDALLRAGACTISRTMYEELIKQQFRCDQEPERKRFKF